MIRGIDAHQHFWKYSPSEYPWIQPEWSIRRDFLPVDLARELEALPIDGCIAVQARQSLEESRWLLSLAEQSTLIRGVVGWVDLRSDDVVHQLEEFADHPKFVGVRHVVQDEPDDAFLLREDFQRGLSKLVEFGLTYDILIYPRQLPSAIRLVESFPHQPFVLDHIAKPPIKDQVLEPWARLIRELASFPNVSCKLSGMITEADWSGWRTEHFRSYCEVVIDCFGSDRLMFGSDWPVLLLAGRYDQVHALASEAVSSWSAEAREKFFLHNAVRFYGLEG